MTNGFNRSNSGSFLGGSWLRNSQIHVSNDTNKQNENVIDVVVDNRSNSMQNIQNMQNKNENRSEEKQVHYDIENTLHHESNSNDEIEIMKRNP
jgi:hypothetical protein